MLGASVKVLDDRDAAAVQRLCEADLAANAFVASRVHAFGCGPARGGGELWGWFEWGRLRSVCWSGANLVPVQASPAAVEAFAARALRQGRRCSSIVGPAEAALGLWRRLEPFWGPARDVRPRQPLMVLDSAPKVAPDPEVRRTGPGDLDVLLPACVAMFTEEVGYSPVAADGGATYRTRVRELVESGRSYARIDADGDGARRVVFKAELGAVTPQVVQVQGVWVDPGLRGRGLGSSGMAAVAAAARRDVAPLVSLYVNDYNAPALAAYRRVGFRETGTLATVLF